MSIKGTNTTADYIDFDRAYSVGNRLLSDDKEKLIGLLVIVAINTGLRISDILRLKWEDFSDGEFKITEKKTGKFRRISINENIKGALKILGEKVGTTGYVFVSQKGSVYSRQYLNRKLKTIFKHESIKHNISTHSLRKSFGRRVYQNNNESEKALVYLSEMFNHSSPSITRKYLGIRAEELNNIYLSL